MVQLGKYELFEQLGRGGYGTVYRARDAALNVERAVKVLHAALLAADPEFVARFRHEAQVAARLEHPHIVPVYDLGEENGSVFLAMRRMPGGSLKEHIQQAGPLPFAEILRITRQVASALDFAYSQPERLIHRDIKPGNILFETNGTARLSDFGFAKALAGGSSTSFSVSGGMIGTPAYMAPEVWMGQPASPATDVYSLGCVAYEMLTGQSLFGSPDTPPPLVMKRHFDPLTLPKTWPQGVPEGIAAVLAKALARDPADRYPSAGAFAAALAGLVADAEQARPRAQTETLRRAEAAVVQIEARRRADAARAAQRQQQAKARAKNIKWALIIGGAILGMALLGTGIAVAGKLALDTIEQLNALNTAAALTQSLVIPSSTLPHTPSPTTTATSTPLPPSATITPTRIPSKTATQTLTATFTPSITPAPPTAAYWPPPSATSEPPPPDDPGAP